MCKCSELCSFAVGVRQVSDLWVSYHALEGGRSSVQLSLPHVLGIDARPGVLPEHSLVISAGASAFPHISTINVNHLTMVTRQK